MKNATKPRKSKLLGFAEQLESGAVVSGSSTGGVHSAVPVAPARPPAERRKTTSAASKEPVAEKSIVDKPAIAAAKPTPPRVPASRPEPPKNPPRPVVPRGIWATTALVIALVVAGPPVAMIAAAFTYPFVIVIGALAIWKIYDLFQTS